MNTKRIIITFDNLADTTCEKIVQIFIDQCESFLDFFPEMQYVLEYEDNVVIREEKEEEKGADNA
jgi:hypothetical protein